MSAVPELSQTNFGLGSLLNSHRSEVSDEEIEDRARYTALGNDSDWDDLTQSMIRGSCAFFAQEVLMGPPEAPYNGKFFLGEHHLEWDELIHQSNRLMVMAPRDHGKTFFFDFAYPIWKILTQPGGTGFIFSATKDQATRILHDIKEELENNPRLQHLVPPKKTGNRWSQTSIQCTNGHTIYARGFGTKVRGAHPNWIVVDDGLNDETAYSVLVRIKQTDYFYSAITNMIVPGGQIIVVGTPFHRGDLYGQLAQNEEYLFKRYKALRMVNGVEVPLWPARYSKESLLRKRREIGMVRFTREFQCEPIADDMSLFPQHLFQGPIVEQTTLTLGMSREFWEPMGLTVFMGVDFALSSSVSADYTVIWVMGLDDHGNRWIMDIVRGKGIPYNEQLSMINQLARKYEPGLVYLEANQAQRIFGDELIRTTDLPIKLFTTLANNKHALDKGVPSLRVLLENRKIRIPRGGGDGGRTIALTDLWIDEMHSITFAEGKVQTVGDHDDTAMAFWICDQACKAGGFSVSFGDEFDGKQSLDDYLGEANADFEVETEEFALEGEEVVHASGNLIDDDFDAADGVAGYAGEWY